MASDITITALTAVGMVGQIAATVMASSPASMSCLPYMQPAKVDIYIAATNNFASATLAGTVNSAVGVLMVDGLSDLATRYLWAIPKDPDGNAGARYPAGGGVSVTTKATVPDGSVTTPKLADGAVSDVKIASMSASKLTAGVVTVTISFTSPIINGGTITGATFQTSDIVTTNRIVIASNTLTATSPSGTLARIGGPSVVSAQYFGYFNAETAVFEANSVSNNAHGLRARNIGVGGGHAVLGVSAGGGGYGLNAQTGGVYSAGGYMPFTGKHECFVRKEADLAVGDVACVERILARDGLDNVLTEVGRAGIVADRRVIGVVSEIKELPPYAPIAALGGSVSGKKQARLRRVLASRYLRVTVNALGEGQMDVCGRGGDIGAGDFIIASDLPGKGQRQNDPDGAADDLLRRCTVAQAMIGVTFDSPDQVKTLPVFYRCG